MSEEKISFEELEAKLANIDIPDADLRVYFNQNKDFARPFQPSLQINRDTVAVSDAEEPRVEAGVVSGFVNSVARFRRRKRFKRDLKEHPDRKVLVSEGDSWFQFPFFLEDVIDQILDSREFNVFSVGAAGDTLQNMVLENPEYLDALDDLHDVVKGFVFSGGGNDIIGEDEQGTPVLQHLVRDFEAGLSAKDHLIEDAVEQQFDFIEKCYRFMLRDVRRDFPQLPVFVHAYGYVFPGNFDASDERDPFYADKEEWIAGPLSEKGIRDRRFQREIVQHLLDRFHTMQVRLAAEDRHLHVINVLDTVDSVNEWNDEIHPNDVGFAKVGVEFVNTIRATV